MMRRTLISVAVLAVPLSLIAGPTVQAASAQGVSTAVITPASGPAGSQLIGSGSNWTPGDHIQAQWGDDNSNLGTPVVVASDGTFKDSFAIPSGATLGSHQVLFWDQEGRYFEVTGFNVGSCTDTQKVTFSPNSGPLTTTFTITGSGWAPGGTVTSSIPYGSPGWFTGYQTPTVNANGGFSFKETVNTGPGGPTPPGAYIFTYVEKYGGCSPSFSQTFTVTSSSAVWTYDPGKYVGKSGMVSVNASLHEPNELKYADYCGPGASQVLISAWTKNVPSIDMLALEENTDPNPPKSGTYISDMVGPINKAIGKNYYKDGNNAGSQGALSNRIGTDILNGHPLITGIMTGIDTIFLNGWNYSGFRVRHIVTIYGFDFSSPAHGKIYYVETAGTVAGTNKTGPQVMDYQSFWTLVNQASVNDQLTGAG